MSRVTVLDGKLHVVHKEGSQVDLRANTLYSLVFFSVASHYIWVAVGTFCGPGLGTTIVMQWRVKGRGPQEGGPLPTTLLI